MDVVLAHAIEEGDGGYYHLLQDDRAGSLCGQVNDESPFAAESLQILPREAAEQHGLNLCRLCHRIVHPE